MIHLLLSLGVSLLLTLILEVSFAFFWSLRAPDLRSGRELLLIVLVNILTNPPVVLFGNAVLALSPRHALWIIPLLELGAVTVEWRYYRACSEALRRPFLFSLCANLFSVLMGFALNLLWNLLL